MKFYYCVNETKFWKVNKNLFFLFLNKLIDLLGFEFLKL